MRRQIIIVQEKIRILLSKALQSIPHFHYALRMQQIDKNAMCHSLDTAAKCDNTDRISTINKTKVKM